MSDFKVDVSGIEGFSEKLKSLGSHKQAFYESCLKELAARLLRKVILRTPVGVEPTWLSPEAREHWKGYVGGTLRRGWTARTEAQAQSGSNVSLESWLSRTEVVHQNGAFYIIISNPVHYASYVENGHRQRVGQFVPALGKRLTKSWVKGQYMLKISEDELRTQAPGIIEKKLVDFLGRYLND